MSPANGWAVATDGQINIRTVTETQAGAAVNWIVYSGGTVFHTATEEQILEFFSANAPAGTVLVPVTVNLKLDG